MSGAAAHAPPSESADDIIARCMNPVSPRSFFLYAGAGAGKTRSLVEGLKGARERHARELQLEGRKIAVITYTNAARDEIERRMGLDPLFHVSTIHSFCWSLIRGYHYDIRQWLKAELPWDIAELRELLAKGRPGTKVAQDRERSIRSKSERLARLDTIYAFTYNPNGDNFGKDSLSHAEVLQITTSFLLSKRLMPLILLNRFPLLMIDESQDTNAALIEALFAVERQHAGKFSLGLFGDTMQRIYHDGKPDLGQALPGDWEKPAKPVNYRSAKRIVGLGNALRRTVDRQEQTSPPDKQEGHVRLFLAPESPEQKEQTEKSTREKMVEATGDEGWGERSNVTALALEHHMAANRLGFGRMWQALYNEDHLKRGLIDGDLPGVRLFAERVLPVVQAVTNGDRFTVAEMLKKHSPLLAIENLASSTDQRVQLASAKTAVEELASTARANDQVTFREVLRCVHRHHLFEIPEALQPFVEQDEAELDDAEGSEDRSGGLQAWRDFLECPFAQIRPYARYIGDDEEFDTQHGVKGLEFKRVLVLLDDSEARGFMYSFNKLMGVEPPSANDTKNEREGRDSSISRTRRLLYVACTRAEQSLAVLVYTNEPAKVRSHVMAQGWFGADEIVSI